MKKTILFLLGIIFFIIGILFGVMLIMNSKSNDIVADDIVAQNELIYSDVKLKNSNTVTTNYSDKKVSPNASLIFKTRYNECKHIEKEVIDVPEDCVNLTANELKEKYSDWEIISFSPKEIILYREEEGICNEHYSIKQDDDMISIYKIGDNDKETFYRNTNIAIKYLAEEDKDKLKSGIKVYSKEELNAVLEDFE